MRFPNRTSLLENNLHFMLYYFISFSYSYPTMPKQINPRLILNRLIDTPERSNSHIARGLDVSAEYVRQLRKRYDIPTASEVKRATVRNFIATNEKASLLQISDACGVSLNLIKKELQSNPPIRIYYGLPLKNWD